MIELISAVRALAPIVVGATVLALALASCGQAQSFAVGDCIRYDLTSDAEKIECDPDEAVDSDTWQVRQVIEAKGSPGITTDTGVYGSGECEAGVTTYTPESDDKAYCLNPLYID